MTRQIRISGTFTTITPYHLAHANVEGQVDDNGAPRVLRGGTAKIPCVMTYKVPVRTTADGESVRAMVPTIPGTSLRGRIRRAAADRIKRQLIATNQVLSREAYHVLQVLSFGSQTIDRGGVRPSNILEAKSDLYAGVFGGGPGLFPSRIITSDAYAVTTETLQLGVLNKDATLRGELGCLSARDTTFAHPYVRRDDLLQFLDPLAPAVVDRYAEAFNSWQAIVVENNQVRSAARSQEAKAVAAKKASKAGKPAETPAEPDAPVEKAKKVSLVGQQAVEAVIPGIDFSFDLSVTGNDAQVGMIISSLVDMLSSEKGLGGFVRNGYGRFAASLSISEAGSSEHMLTSDGRGTLFVMSEKAQNLINAFEAELSGYTAAQFQRAYMLTTAEAA